MVRKKHHAPDEGGSEPWSTMTDVAAFRHHDALTLAYTSALKEGRCRKTTRFSHDLASTVAVLRPLVGPWNLEILFLLYMEGPLRFLALKRALGPVSSRVLTDKLRRLAEDGLVERIEAGRAVSYVLSSRGQTVARHLHPVVFFLRNSGTQRVAGALDI